MKLRSRERILLGILGVVAVIGLLALWGGGDEGRTPPGESLAERSSRLREEASRAPLETEIVGLNLAALERGGGEFEVGRNPFRYAPKPRPPAPPPRPEPEPEPEPKKKEPPPSPPEPKEERCRPPSASDLEYLGFFGPEGGEIAVIVRGEEIYNVREGGRIQGEFIVEEIGFESLALSFVKCPEEPAKRLPVGGSR
ncbi:MAG: hypothetical protein R3234_12250 [Thermoanaerobaculia bacterium]|nr:hypothetical protein [Thermoanaerobaculia bacterium]